MTVLILVYARKHTDSTPHCIETAAKFLMNDIPADRACEFTSVESATGETATSIAVSKTTPNIVITIIENRINNTTETISSRNDIHM